MRLGFFATAMWLLWFAGCAFRGGNGPDALPGETTDSSTAELTTNELGPGEGQVCVPAKVLRCSDDKLGQVVCNDEGSGYEVEPCPEDSLCLKDEVGCTNCKPGRTKCQDDNVVLRCDADGMKYEPFTECNPDETGQVCYAGACRRLCEINSKLPSYIGCEYWGVDLDNALVPGGANGWLNAAGAQYAIVVANTNPKYSARVQIFTKEGEVTVDSQGNPFPSEPIPPMGLRIFNLPRTRADGSYMDAEGTLLQPLAYRIVSSIPITAYEFNPLENVDVFSNDASILLPTHALGKYYIVMTREQTFDELKGYVTVVAVYPGDTQVTLTVTAPTLPGDGIPALKPGDSFSAVMKQFDVLNIETNEFGADLSGTVVSANKPVVVFGGSEASNAPNTNHCCPDGDCGDATFEQTWLLCLDGSLECYCEWPAKNLVPRQLVSCRTNYDCIKYNTCCADHLEMQLFPVKTWGQEYIATASYPRGGEKDVWRVMAAEKGTKFTTYPNQVTTAFPLDTGEYVDFESSEHFEIHANKPILVGQFLAAQDAPDPNINGIKGKDDAMTGDPTFILAVPVEQFRKDYVFLAPNKYMFDCVNIIVPMGATVYLDGEELRPEDLTFEAIREIMKEMKEKEIEDPMKLALEKGVKYGDYAVIGTGKWAVFRLVISDGVHTATSDQPFGVISYGYDQYVSYGYPAGLNLTDLKLIEEK